MTLVRRIAALGLMLCTLGTTSGCIKKALLEGQIKTVRKGSEAVNSFHDYELAKAVAEAGVAQSEGMHYLAPDNTDALFMLTKSWSGISFAFTEDEYEQALEKGDEVMAQYHLMRTRAGFQRAIFYALELLSHHAQGFESAKRNQETLRAWLVENFTEKEQAEDLLWAGFAWIGNVVASREIPAVVAELYIGVGFVKRSVELDPDLMHGMGHTVLGGYHARSPMAELDQAKLHFDKALAINGGKFLSTKLNLATKYYCAKGDRANYEKTLHEILEAGDVLPEARLQNTIAKRRARRYLGNKVWQEDCGFK